MPSKELENSIKYLFDAWIEGRRTEIAGMKKIRYSGIDFGKEEYRAMLDAIFNDWWSGGKYTISAEKWIAGVGMRNHALLVNSGSSANLLLMCAAKECYFEDGAEILTLSCGFPTTANAIIQAGMMPVFVDIDDVEGLTVSPEMFEAYLNDNKTIQGAFLPHTLGRYGKIDELLDVARKHNVLVFFDACDSYGSTYKDKPLVHYGKAATYSFYAAHHASCGEGGAISTNDDKLFYTMRGLRNWGRYCASEDCCIRSVNPEAFCPNTKLTQKTSLPEDYMVNYQYEWMGYNMKMLDLQAAIIEEQFKRLDSFTEIRWKNYMKLFDFFDNSGVGCFPPQDGFSPFSFPIILKDNAERKHLINHLKQNGVESRMIFAGNLLKHPAYLNKPTLYRQIKEVHDISNRMMNCGLMVGVSHVLSEKQINRMIIILDAFFRRKNAI